MSDGRDDRDESARVEGEGSTDPDDGRQEPDGSPERASDDPEAAPRTTADPDAAEPHADRSGGAEGAAGSEMPPGAAGSGERSSGERTGAGVHRDWRRTDPAEYTTEQRSLSPRVQFQWGIRATISAVVVGLIATFALRALDQDPRLGGLITAALVVAGFVWVLLYYRIWVYQIQDDAIYLERGVFTHVRTLVPYVRIQHVDTSRGPFERALGLSTLVVYTAGSRGADVSIPGLTPAEARDLQQRVKELAIEAEGDDAL